MWSLVACSNNEQNFGPESLANKQKMFGELVDKRFSLQHLPSDVIISLVDGFIELSLPECELPAQGMKPLI